MAKAKDNQKPPEGVVVPTASPEDGAAPIVPPVSPDPETESSEEFREYVANWSLHGLPCGPLEAGETVELEEEQAAPLVECGVLSPVGDK